MAKGIGIDFGTTNSSIAVAQDERTSETVLFRTGAGTTETYRSVLYFEPKTPGVSGPRAIERYLAADEKGRLIQSLKSFLASRTFTGTSIYGRQFPVEDLITIMLRDLRIQAEEQIGAFDGPVVVGRPVRYSNASGEDDNQFALDRLKRALDKAGIGQVIFEYEPVAAAYFYESRLDHDELILIGDFGGGTSDFSLLRVGPSARREGTHRILGTEGVALAGDAFDARIIRNLISLKLGRTSEYRSLDKVLPMPEWVYSDLERWHYLSFLKSNATVQMLRSIETHSFEPEKIAALLHVVQNDLGFYLHRSVQGLKTELSSEPVGTFVFEDHVLQMRGRVKRPTFEGWIEEDLQKIRGCLDRLLAACDTRVGEVDRVFLTGGSSQVPAVRRIFEQRFGTEKISSGNEFTSVARGLALRAAVSE
nr:chaperone protein DnaK [uncultured bacterium]